MLGGAEATPNFYVEGIAHSTQYTTACVVKVSTPNLHNLSTAMLVSGFGSPQVSIICLDLAHLIELCFFYLARLLEKVKQ